MSHVTFSILVDMLTSSRSLVVGILMGVRLRARGGLLSVGLDVFHPSVVVHVHAKTRLVGVSFVNQGVTPGSAAFLLANDRMSDARLLGEFVRLGERLHEISAADKWRGRMVRSRLRALGLLALLLLRRLF
jgi:hypothetical protein